MKKLLALVLAMVMTLGLATVSASAAFPDADDVSFVEAVDVMSAVGVFKGDDNGNFLPKANLTREAAAKLIAYLDLGETTAEALPAVKVFDDVAADRWSAKYIAYCADAGYIAGDGTGKFLPTGELTGYAFGKMLLCVLGYDADIEGFTGNNWTIAVAKLMQSNKLAKSVSGNASATLTREQAAQYCFNALHCDMVGYESKGTNVTINGAVIASGASKADPADADFVGTLKAKLYANDKKESDKNGLFKKEDTDEFGRPAYTWYLDGDDVATYTESPVLTYTAEVKASELYADLKKPVKADNTAATYTLTTDGKADATAIQITKANTATTIGGNGALVEVFETKTTGEYKVFVTNTYVGEIKTWTAAKTDKQGEVTAKEHVTLLKAASAEVTNKFETTDFSKDDEKSVVYYTMAWDGKDAYKIQSMTIAPSVEASVSSVKAGTSFVADGTTYKFAEKSDFTNNYITSNAEVKYDKDAKYTLYLDAYGYVLSAQKVTESTTTGYAIVTAVSQNGGTWTDDSATYSAKIVKADGTTETVACDKASYDLINTTNDKKATLVKYTVNSKDVYSFATTQAALADADANFKVEQGKANITKTSSAKTVANSKTLFFIGKTNDKVVTWTVYTGIASVPSLTDDATKTNYAELLDGSVAKAIAVLDGKAASATTTSADIAFVQYKNAPVNTDALGTYQTYNAVVGGKITEVNVNSTKVSDLFSGKDILVASLTYTDDLVTGSSDNYASKVAEGAGVVKTDASNGIVTITITKTSTDTTYSIAEDVAVFVSDASEDTIESGSVSDLVASSNVLFITTDDVITFIVVTA
ncbi:MAG: S-layer homology domain-containing protein [Oscillospiraceae bacterium]|nr:S-layer homology domain-containing protein [Oscillospiraceae bacterium]